MVSKSNLQSKTPPRTTQNRDMMHANILHWNLENNFFFAFSFTFKFSRLLGSHIIYWAHLLPSGERGWIVWFASIRNCVTSHEMFVKWKQVSGSFVCIGNSKGRPPSEPHSRSAGQGSLYISQNPMFHYRVDRSHHGPCSELDKYSQILNALVMTFFIVYLTSLSRDCIA